jgi:8-oxo-dGTP pyrophosphatase MutT (NUDIX family)
MKTIGIIVGRFQTHELTKAHKWLISQVAERSDSVIVLLGEAPARLTEADMLPHFLRTHNITNVLPFAIVDHIMDQSDNNVWYKMLDRKVAKLVKRHNLDGEVILYGGRDSFISSYKGSYKTYDLTQEAYENDLVFYSATEERKNLFKSIVNGSYKITKDFLAGFMFAAHYKFPTSYQAVDAAMYKTNTNGESFVLMGRKSNESLMRFPGGIVDPGDNDHLQGNLLELSAARELFEETTNIVPPQDMVYLGSYRTNDSRYRRAQDKIATALFAIDVTDKNRHNGFDGYEIVGEGYPGDDLAETFWVSVQDVVESQITLGHRVLFKRVKQHIQNK